MSAESTETRIFDGISVGNIPGDPSAIFVPRKGLQIPQRLAFDKWFEIGRYLSSLTTSSAWCLGDWLVYGESAYEGRYRKAVEETMLDYQTLRNYAWVARRFPLSRRRDTLSFGHHAEVASLPETEQEYWLRQAEESSWSRNTLRRQVRMSLQERERVSEREEGAGSGEPAEEKTVGQAAIEVNVPECPALTLKVSFSRKQLDIFSTAARVTGVSLEDWVLHALETVASGALSR